MEDTEKSRGHGDRGEQAASREQENHERGEVDVTAKGETLTQKFRRGRSENRRRVV